MIKKISAAAVVIILMIVFAGCSPCKRLQRKCPPQIVTETHDSLVIKDTIIYKDKVVEIEIPGDTVYAEKKVPVKEDITPIWAQNDYASARAWVENSKMKLELIQKEQVIKAIIEKAEKETIHWKEKYFNTSKVEIVVREKDIPGIYNWALWLCIVIFAGVFVFVGYKIFKFFK